MANAGRDVKPRLRLDLRRSRGGMGKGYQQEMPGFPDQERFAPAAGQYVAAGGAGSHPASRGQGAVSRVAGDAWSVPGRQPRGLLL